MAVANKKKSGSKKKKIELRDVAKARKELTEEMARAVKGGATRRSTMATDS